MKEHPKSPKRHGMMVSALKKKSPPVHVNSNNRTISNLQVGTHTNHHQEVVFDSTLGGNNGLLPEDLIRSETHTSSLASDGTDNVCITSNGLSTEEEHTCEAFHRIVIFEEMRAIGSPNHIETPNGSMAEAGRLTTPKRREKHFLAAQSLEELFEMW
uniref:Uncharacterized protein n=1 Tax=Trieres chinensis TaxID=1514140 RepID=A0A7S1ZAW0_TRICV|mmetsp:Transcript_21196/g.42782  ORF Transcript_21196/g.42782 Transcript_21196/m.42782 type:complete len:157 (+) Transcript_21196:169-639(+)|eukprot:CAMPEP_0183294276 /NCGR_PEP_ID=MMETSP0160_2-20130417/2682_1 /TAXON_ID=2839 ORGANISM="Odontella Sinensis, Strain Grunow 1884" /NCGR_SAMPLE_ID=MMETSP0160_2 /ASSEMBLY_ACC=CAM_ASM_000250 /LENGTH=156 /DNA_ID=CAMNT_0025455571 /DNA_START=151 /DNA_END=618 /DNA_ORIENTATION=+